MEPNFTAPQQERPRRNLADVRDRLILALEGMTLNPNQGLMQVAASGLKERAEGRRSAATQSRTVDALQRMGADPSLIQLAQAGYGKAAVTEAMRRNRDGSAPNVQSSQMLPDQSGVVTVFRDGSVRVTTAGGQTLEGDEANDFVRKSQEAYTTQQRDIYGARREGTLGADVALGGEAERARQEGKMAPQMAKEFADNASLVRSSVRNIDDALAALDRGAEAGIVYNMLPNVTEASASLSNAMDRMGLDVIGSVTFGALSEAELRLAMETAVPRNLGPEDLREWLTRKREAQAKAYQGMMEAAQHFANGGTQAEYYQMIGADVGGSAPMPPSQPSVDELSDDDLLKKYGG